MKTNFYLNSHVATDGRSLIYAQVAWDSQTMKVYFGARIRPDGWDRKKQRAKKDSILNSLLIRTEDLIREAFMQAQMNTSSGTLTPTRAEVKNWLRRYLQVGESTRTELQGAYMAALEQRVVPTRVKHIRYALETLEKFFPDWELSDVNLTMYDKLCAKLAEESTANNTIGRIVKDIKGFLNWCKARGHRVNTAGWSKITEQVAIVTLTDEELQRIEALELDERLSRVRAIFLVECFTGLRFSDVIKIEPGSLQSGTLRIVTRKTREALTIPVSARAMPWVQAYLEKPSAISNQKLNQYLKEIARLAGITEPIRRVRHSGAKRMEETFPKCDLVTSHTGRRTFVTLSLERGVRPEVLMRVTGHKDIKTLMRYVHVSANVTREEMKKAWG